MNFRIKQEKLESEILSEFAAKSTDVVRKYPQEKCLTRTEFQRDRDRILHSKSFRRLKHKTQVFLSPEGDHYRTRLTHTLEVAQIARTIARALRLNEDLTEAIALGHDLGHTPFGHCGEAVLAKIHPTGFRHNQHSKRVVEFIETRGSSDRGLNLTGQVLEGIECHSGDKTPKTLEGQVVRFADKIGYLNHDMDDSIRAKILSEDDIPLAIQNELGSTHKSRIDNMIKDITNNSYGKDSINFSEERYQAFSELRKFMFSNVYLNPKAKAEEIKAERIVEMLYNYFADDPSRLPEDRRSDYYESEGIEAVKDHIAGMSDRYAVNLFRDIYIPKFWL